MAPTKPGIDEKVSTREIPPMSLRASFRPGSVDAEKRTVEVVWTTGARVLRGFYDRFYEELSLTPKHVRMERLTSGRAPLLNSHGGYSLSGVLGVVESARIEGKQGTAVVRFPKAEDDPEADKIFRKVVDGILTNISVGYRVHRFEKVEGGEDKIPVYRAVDWEPYELSLVGMPADAGAGVRSEASDTLAPCEFVSRSEERAMSETAAVQDPKTPVQATAPAPSEDATRAAVEAATRAERERVTGIRHAVLVAARSMPTAGIGDELADQLVRDGVSLDQARAAVLDRLAAESDKVRTESHVRVEAGEDASDKFRRGAGAWLLQKAALAGMIERAKQECPGHAAFRDLETDPGEFRGMTLVDLARESLERHGVKTRGMAKLDIVGRALTFRSSFNSTSDFAVLMESTMNKTLLASYATTADVWSRLCAVRSASDFRAQNFYRQGAFGSLDSLNEHGEFKNKQIPDAEKTSYAIGTKGNIIGLSRQAIINDDMGAFNDLATRWGRAAKLSIEVDFFALLSQNAGLGPVQGDGQPFFHAANRGNVNGTGSALSVAGLDADRVVLAQQRDPNNQEFLDLRPAILLVPIGLGGEARVLNGMEFDDTDNKFRKPNKVRGLFREVVDTPRLSGTRRYLFVDPAIVPAFVVAFLDGAQFPYLESQEGWRMDGVEWKVRIDYGVAAVEPRGAVTNAGA